jgi:SAM-dependent MidA family methyltransferase
MTADDAMHESAHAARVLETIRARVATAGGWLPFDQYMDLALYEPGLGYYSAGAGKLGAGGDFTTAPEISPLFGQCLARHCAEVLEACGGAEVLEIGAGTGRLALDVLTGMRALGVPPVRYRILEVSADLRQRQRELLARLAPQLLECVEWLDAPPAHPWQGALIANEVLDALPVECFTWRDGEVAERGVAVESSGKLVWRERPAAVPLCAEVQRLRAEVGAAWPAGFRSELCRRGGPWIDEVTRTLERGVALFIDYGLSRREYYDAHRDDGTLRCHYRQRAHDDPFAHPGLEDITAWVDFTRIAEAGDAVGLEVLGYATQAALLLGLGIEHEIAGAADEATRIRRASEARRLLMPEEMGENFKAIALGRGVDVPLEAFAVQDLRSRL